jgi:flagellar export protein FliJ
MKSRGEALIRLKRFQVDEKRRQLASIDSMIAEMARMAKDLDDQIVSEQNRVGIHDVTHFAYPTFAKAAMTRRDNLKVSIQGLEAQREAARDALSEAVEDLKKLELIDERDAGRERNERDAREQEAMDEMAGRRHAYR